MKMKLMGGVALALLLGISSTAYANPKNSFANFNTIVVVSNAVAAAQTGDNNIGCAFCGGGGGGADSSTANAWSESFNLSVEAVEVSTLTVVSIGHSQNTFDLGTVFGNNHDNANIHTGNAGATASGDGLAQAAAASGNGAVNLQGQSVAAAGNIRF